jgi:hypothetical protein
MATVPHHQVEVTTAARFFAALLGVDPAGGMTLARQRAGSVRMSTLSIAWSIALGSHFTAPSPRRPSLMMRARTGGSVMV